MTEPEIRKITADYDLFYKTGELVEYENGCTFFVVEKIQPECTFIDVAALMKPKNYRFNSPLSGASEPLVLLISDKKIALKQLQYAGYNPIIRISEQFTLEHEIDVGVSPLELVGDARPNVITVTTNQEVAFNGGGGDDTIIGGSGRNRFYASEGKDSFVGGPGENLYIFDHHYNATIQPQNGQNIITFDNRLFNYEALTAIKHGDNLLIMVPEGDKTHQIDVLNFFSQQDKFSFDCLPQELKLSPQGNDTYNFTLANK